MWKAFVEMLELGWIDGKLPRMICVQAEGCVPIPRALATGKEFASLRESVHTVAASLHVPQAIRDFLILRAIRESNGTAIAICNDALIASQETMTAEEGIFACPREGRPSPFWKPFSIVVRLRAMRQLYCLIPVPASSTFRHSH